MRPQKTPETKIFIVLEHPEGWGGTPDDIEDMVLGVFFDKKAATEKLQALSSYYYSRWGSRLILDEGKTQDEHGIPVY